VDGEVAESDFTEWFEISGRHLAGRECELLNIGANGPIGVCEIGRVPIVDDGLYEFGGCAFLTEILPVRDRSVMAVIECRDERGDHLPLAA
jgi:hypothetical protein